VNVSLILVFSQGVRIVLVGLIIGLFYVVFGLFTVRLETIAQWTTDTPDVLARWNWFGHRVVITWELLRVSGFIAAFSALQFSVSAVTDDAYRREFFADTISEIRDALAVRLLYLETLVDRGA
jgi:signal transduction histidine kinase